MLVSSKRTPQTEPSFTKDICVSVCNIWSTPQLKDEGDEILIGITAVPINHIKEHISSQDLELLFDAVAVYLAMHTHYFSTSFILREILYKMNCVNS